MPLIKRFRLIADVNSYYVSGSLFEEYEKREGFYFLTEHPSESVLDANGKAQRICFAHWQEPFEGKIEWLPEIEGPSLFLTNYRARRDQAILERRAYELEMKARKAALPKKPNPRKQYPVRLRSDKPEVKDNSKPLIRSKRPRIPKPSHLL